jgi:hypothetical protein
MELVARHRIVPTYVELSSCTHPHIMSQLVFTSNAKRKFIIRWGFGRLCGKSAQQILNVEGSFAWEASPFAFAALITL